MSAANPGSPEILETLLDSVHGYAIYMLDPKGFVRSWNAGAERTKGYFRNEIIGQHYACFFTPEDRAEDKPRLQLELARATGRFEIEAWRVRKDGSRFWAMVLIEPIFGPDGHLIGFAKITRDISERRQQDQARERLFQTRKLEAVGLLRSSISHDFGNLLQAMQLNIELIRALSKDRAVGKVCAATARAVERGMKLTSQLLSYSQNQELNPSACDINDVIFKMETEFARVCGPSAGVKFQLQPTIWPVHLDETRFESALLNLVTNSREAMPEGGTIIIETRNVVIGKDDARYLGQVTAGDYIRLAVSDTGHGMTPTEKDSAFEPFFSTKTSGRESGLGLSEVYGFVRQSRGYIQIDTELGTGTSIVMYFPRSCVVVDFASGTANNTARTRGTIVLVDENADVLDASAAVLRSAGYQVHAAEHESAALGILGRGTSINLLIADMGMPSNMNGIELSRHARKLQPSLPVLLTSNNSVSDEQLAELREEVRFIAKPYSAAALIEHVTEILKEAD